MLQLTNKILKLVQIFLSSFEISMVDYAFVIFRTISVLTNSHRLHVFFPLFCVLYFPPPPHPP